MITSQSLLVVLFAITGIFFGTISQSTAFGGIVSSCYNRYGPFVPSLQNPNQQRCDRHFYHCPRDHRTLVATIKRYHHSSTTKPTTTLLWNSNQDQDESDSNKKQGSLDGSVRTKLLSESIAPWRTLRFFLYASFASGAMIGGLITLTGTLAVVSGAREGNLNTELLNLGIDFGAVAVFAFLFKWDLDKETELRSKVEEKMELKQENIKRTKLLKDRETELGSLKVSIQVASDKTQVASIRELQFGAKQHLIIVAGSKKVCRDALIGANLLKMDFAMSNVLVVPYDVDAASVVTTETALSTNPIGFGTESTRPVYETQPYVAKHTGDGWSIYIKAEIDDAIEQNGDKVKEEGIAIVVANNGKIIRRGVGKVPWRLMVEELEQSVKEKFKSLF